MDRQKEKLFSASVRCPKCGLAINVRVSDDPNYSYCCLECNERFGQPYEHLNTVSDRYEITLHGKTSKWYAKHRESLRRICDEYHADFMGCDDYHDPENVFIDFGWENMPTTEQVQGFTDKIADLGKE